MTEQERPLIDRVWEFTKDLSVKVSRKAEKHWKINTLRVEIASVKHRINVKYKELGRFVFESIKSGTVAEETYKSSVREYFDELARLEGEIEDRMHRIDILEREMEKDTEETGEQGAGEAEPETAKQKDGAPKEKAAEPPPVPKAEKKPAKKTAKKPKAKAKTKAKPKKGKTTES